MKSILMCFLFFANFFIYPTTISGRFIVYNYSDTSAGIKLQINTNIENGSLGGATFIINFDTASLSFNSLPEENYNYTFHNFSGGSYEKAFLTKVLPNQLWINIESLSDSAEPAEVISGWMDVITINFRKKNGAETFWVEADKNSLYWSVFDGDNKTLWEPGDFTVENTVTDNKQNTLPEDFELCQNYPNPFNPSTKIKFKLQSGGNTKLIVYDLLGNEILRLVDKDLPSGNYEAELDGRKLSSGMYIYSLRVDGKYSGVKKMMLLK
ncbi:MAG TPA: T9SS type A sorting domain-containing protein [Ignavibacteriaceae bacterium]|nr:T9SS type A sorting domain-containing protein [Ignavibacteriaceae bacterium]